MRINQQSAQSVIEYSALAVVLVLAIVFGGPFLVNSVNGRFRIMDNNVRDSFGEKIKQSPGSTITPVCVCTPDNLDPSSWSPGMCGSGSCSETERRYSRVCAPMNCSSVAACVPDPICCSTPVDNVMCGQVFNSPSLPSHACFSRETLGPAFDATYRGRCLNASGDVMGCAIGEREWKSGCGTTGSLGTTLKYGCKADTTCLPVCAQQDVAPTYAAWCSSNEQLASNMLVEMDLRVRGVAPARGYSVFNITETTPYVRPGAYKVWTTYLASVADCAPGRYCEKYCTNCLVPRADQLTCVAQDDCHVREQFGPGVKPKGAVLPAGFPATTLLRTYAHRIKLSAYAQDLYWIVQCKDAVGNITSLSQSYGGVNFKSFECIAHQMYFQLWAGSASNPNAALGELSPAIGYQVCEQLY